MIPSTVEHPNAGLGVFGTSTISKCETIGAYYVSLVSRIYLHYLYKQPLSMKEYGEWCMAVSISTFNPCATALPNMTTDCPGIKHSCWIVSVLFCAISYIKDERYFTGDAMPTAAKQLSPHQNNVLFRHKKSLIADFDFTKF